MRCASDWQQSAFCCRVFSALGGSVCRRSRQQESDYESRMDTYVLVLQNYGKSMENVVTVLENDVYIRKLINRNTFTWDNTAGIAAQEVTNLVSVNPMIHSVYVWLEDDYLIKSTNPSYPIDQNGGCADAGYFPDEHVSRECGHSISGYLWHSDIHQH